MSGRSGAGHPRPAALGPQPLKATVPYKLSSKPRSNRRDGKSAGKANSHQLNTGMRRTMSLDAIIGPYLQGHWPKEPENQSSLCRKDKATQTPASWGEKSEGRGNGSSHKRSASWGSAEHLREITKLKQQLQQCGRATVSQDRDSQCGYPIGTRSPGATQTQPIPISLTPLSTLVPRLRCSVEGLNQELEGMFISHPANPQHTLLEVPDGHRAPAPLHSCWSESQCDSATALLSSSSSSSPSSSPNFICTPLSNSEDAYLDPQQDGAEVDLSSPSSSQNESDVSLPLLISSSPGPNKSFCFQREPPEGCEKVRVSEEISALYQLKPTLVSSCPDPNKINFTSHGGSAFCPVSLLKPLLPSMDRLFRNLTISPSGSSSCQSASPDPPAATTVMGEASGTGLAF